MRDTVRWVLEGISALLILVVIEVVAVGFVYLLADSNGFYPPPPALALAGVIGLGLWFCVIYTIWHRHEMDRIGRTTTPWRPLR